jgi:hypothetical protein
MRQSVSASAEVKADSGPAETLRPVQLSLQLRRHRSAHLWIAEIPQLVGVRALAKERDKAVAQVRQFAVFVLLDRCLAGHDAKASEQALLEVLSVQSRALVGSDC